MGLPPQEEPRRHNNGGTQMATDEAVRMIVQLLIMVLTELVGDGTFQEEDAQVTTVKILCISRYRYLSRAIMILFNALRPCKTNEFRKTFGGRLSASSTQYG